MLKTSGLRALNHINVALKAVVHNLFVQHVVVLVRHAHNVENLGFARVVGRDFDVLAGDFDFLDVFPTEFVTRNEPVVFDFYRTLALSVD